jgi:hypothetical protein
MTGLNVEVAIKKVFGMFPEPGLVTSWCMTSTRFERFD